MTYKELLERTPFEEIEPYIVKTYTWGTDGLWLWRLHYDMLRSLTPNISPKADSFDCVIGMSEGFHEREPFLYAAPIKCDSWEHCLAKNLKLLPEVTASWPEIAACCLWHSSFRGYTQYEADKMTEFLRISKLTVGEKARMYVRQIKRKGGDAPTSRLVTPTEKKLRISQVRKAMRRWKKCKENRLKRKRAFRKTFMSFYYGPIIAISRFILDTEPAWKDPSNPLSIKRLCGLYDSLAFRTEVLPSYVRDDMGISAAKYLENLIRKYPFFERKDFNRVIIHMVTGEPHERLSDDEQALINFIVEGRDGEQPFEGSDLLFSTDPSLGKQIILRLAFYKSDRPL